MTILDIGKSITFKNKIWRCPKCGGRLMAVLKGTTGMWINDETQPLDIVFTCISCFVGVNSRYKISILPEQMETLDG